MISNPHPMGALAPTPSKQLNGRLYRLLSPVGLLALAPLLASCQPSDETTAAPAPAGTAASAVPAVPGSADSPGLPQSPPAQTAASAPGQATIDENQRIIAENQRLLAQIARYTTTDPAKLERVQTQCEQRLGKPADADLERRVARCIINAW